MRRETKILGWMLGLLTVVLLAQGHHQVGYVRDEGVYFEASRNHAAWFRRLARSPSDALRPAVRDRHFGFNREHPPTMKSLAALSAMTLARPPTDEPDTGGAWPVMPEGAAMRLPAQIVAGLGVVLLFFAGHTIAGLGGGILAAGWFIALPRVWFHAGLHAFDVPIAVAILAVVLCYRRSLADWRWGLALGPALGIAITIKHNALFVGPLLALHYYVAVFRGRRAGGTRPTAGQLVGLPLVSMAVLAPLVAFALWPWLWSAPVERLTEYFEFHRQHSYYNMELFGRNHNQPPMPFSYPWVMTWATVPTCLLVLAGIGLGIGIRRDLKASRDADAAAPTFGAPLPRGWPRLDGTLWALLGLFPLLLIALPSTPIFGGTKHWLTAYPFLALAAATGWGALWKTAPARWRRPILRPVALSLLLLPAGMATIDGHPYTLSQYAPLVGGPRGAASWGLNRGFWGHAARPMLPTAQELGGALYLHDLHDLARKQYVRDGSWPEGLGAVPLSRARTALLFHELHMTANEVEVWNALGTTAPRAVITLDDVPLTSLYAVDRE